MKNVQWVGDVRPGCTPTPDDLRLGFVATYTYLS